MVVAKDRPPGLGYLLRRSYFELRRRLQSGIAPLDMTPDQYSVLYVLDRPRGRRQREVSELIHTDPNTLVGILRRLETKGWIQRTADETDRRNVVVQLTNAGARVRKKALAFSSRMKTEAVRCWTADELDQVFRLLERLLDHLTQEAEGSRRS